MECKDANQAGISTKQLRINRNIVECKVLWTRKLPAITQGINRNIVECKVRYRSYSLASLLRINRNIVECKVVIGLRYFRSGYVLIETLWNVKALQRHEGPRIHRVLIETLWNVKKAIEYQKSGKAKVLIETLWNVKQYVWKLLNDDNAY